MATASSRRSLPGGLRLARVAGLLAITPILSALDDPGEPLVLHVSPTGHDSWSRSLAEPNASRSDGPLATPQRARDVLRERRRAGTLPAAEVRLRAGRYRLAEPLVFRPEDSGPTT